MSKTAVVLFNLGGPDSKEAIKPFLYNFFMDKNIIRAPLPVRWAVAKMISVKRSKAEAGDSYGHLDYKSPLLENSVAQARALEKELGGPYKTFVCMRYWNPMADEIVKQVKDYAPDNIVLLPLYPQFSTTTTRSSFEAWDEEARTQGLDVPTTKICCYPMEDGFIEASANYVLASYNEALEKTRGKNLMPPRVLFSAHGLPEDIIKDGDPYQWQVEETAQAIVDKMGMRMLDWQVCYQSRVGPKKWIGPSTEEALRDAALNGIPVVIYPHAFVSEHVETLVEIEIEYREMAKELEIPCFVRVPTVGTEAAFIRGLANTVTKAVGQEGIFSSDGVRLCPAGFDKCCMQGQAAMKKAA